MFYFIINKTVENDGKAEAELDIFNLVGSINS